MRTVRESPSKRLAQLIRQTAKKIVGRGQLADVLVEERLDSTGDESIFVRLVYSNRVPESKIDLERAAKVKEAVRALVQERDDDRFVYLSLLREDDVVMERA